jgi:hypothetical protein
MSSLYIPWLVLVQSKKRLDREKGLQQLQELVNDGTLGEEERREGEREVSDLVTSLTSPWEAKHGGLMAAAVLLPGASPQFMEKMKGEVPLLLEYDESRVRLAAGEVAGALCAVGGEVVCREVLPFITGGIEGNLERDSGEVDTQLTQKLSQSSSSSSSSSPENSYTEDRTERAGSPTAAEVFHDTAGWRHLETYMVALQRVVERCGSAFEPHLTSDLLQLVFTCLSHTNRFVRETGYRVIAAFISIPGLSTASVSAFWPDIARNLAKGLSDNWSQVRMSSSVATRMFLIQLPSLEAREPYFPSLLPPLCLNRHYVAEGVRLYCQETWRLVTEMKGVQLVEKYIAQVVEFYISQTEATNHAVREAACACIAELGTKVTCT